MKKLLLTGITAALVSFAAIGQQQDSVQNQSNQFRQSDQQQQDPAQVDSTSTEFQQGDNQNLQQPGNEFNREDNQTQDSVNTNDMERPGNQVQQNGQENPDNSQEGVQQQNESMDQSGDRNTDSTMNQMNDRFRSSAQGQEGSANVAPDVEVVPSKEGPDHQVVYQYQGDMYYIDRDKKELVKAKESDLKDSDQKVIVKEGGEENASDNTDGNQ